jgi:hypothetical protein
MKDSEVVVHNGGTTFAGPDAVALYAAVALKVSLALYAKTGMKMTRMATPTAMLQAATRLTGHKYKRGAYLEAAEDVRVWVETMKTGMPYRDERTKA